MEDISLYCQKCGCSIDCPGNYCPNCGTKIDRKFEDNFKINSPFACMGFCFFLMVVGGFICSAVTYWKVPFVEAVWFPYFFFAPLAIHGFCWLITDFDDLEIRWYNKDLDLLHVCIAHYCGSIISNDLDFDIWKGAIFCIALFFVSKFIFWLIRSRKNKNSEKDG